MEHLGGALFLFLFNSSPLGKLRRLRELSNTQSRARLNLRNSRNLPHRGVVPYQ